MFFSAKHKKWALCKHDGGTGFPGAVMTKSPIQPNPCVNPAGCRDKWGHPNVPGARVVGGQPGQPCQHVAVRCRRGLSPGSHGGQRRKAGGGRSGLPDGHAIGADLPGAHAAPGASLPAQSIGHRPGCDIGLVDRTAARPARRGKRPNVAPVGPSVDPRRIWGCRTGDARTAVAGREPRLRRQP
jgi:hypothetical protein